MIKTLLAGIVAEKIYKNPKVKKALDKGFDESLKVGKKVLEKGKVLLDENEETVEKVKNGIKSGIDKVKEFKDDASINIKEEDIEDKNGDKND